MGSLHQHALKGIERDSPKSQLHSLHSNQREPGVVHEEHNNTGSPNLPPPSRTKSTFIRHDRSHTVHLWVSPVWFGIRWFHQTQGAPQPGGREMYGREKHPPLKQAVKPTSEIVILHNIPDCTRRRKRKD